MPELPEVETTVKGLNSKVLKRAFVDVWTDSEKILKKPKNFKEFTREIKGKKINKIWRRAKNIIFDLSGDCSLLVHQKMTGHLLVGNWKLEDKKWRPVGKGPLNDPYNRFLHLIFFLNDPPSRKASDGRSGKMLALSDLRKFAKVELWKTDELLDSKEFKNLGPEPLDKDFTFEKFKDILRNRKGKIKQVLMNQEIIAGIGNIYSSEALWHSKINPFKDASELDEKELKELYRAIKKVLKAGIRLGGESFSDYRKVDGSKGDFDTERRVYKRENQKCHRCGTLIKRLKFAGRSA
ncbi:MAG: hypothetical protein A2812_01715, partial [Candidatus Staskawiczbacteria bacterium RIFCSPHIGHO2_01_FULL_36_16]